LCGGGGESIFNFVTEELALKSVEVGEESQNVVN